MKIKFITAIIIIVLLTLLFAACKKPYEKEAAFAFSYYNTIYGYNDIEIETVDNNIAMGDNKEEALLYLVELAKSNLVLLPYASKIAVAEGKTTAGKLGYVNMIASSIFIAKENSWYFQSISKFNEAKPDMLLPIMQPVLDKAERHFSEDSQSVFVQNIGKKGNICAQENFPYNTCDFSKASGSEYAIADTTDYRNDFNNISTFVINNETIVSEGIKVSRNSNYYVVEFELDLSTEQAKEMATAIQRDYLRQLSKLPSLNYEKIEIALEIWDNGLPKSMTVLETWKGQMTIFLIELTIDSVNTTKHYYSYHPDDSDYEKQNVCFCQNQE
ncbi:MAG: hypothetical protein EOM87_02535 [Clostridia bacterium]|nr:hypothetical protein [Clostridia bacterium]